jgi:hypothetical protein
MGAAAESGNQVHDLADIGARTMTRKMTGVPLFSKDNRAVFSGIDAAIAR